MKRLMQLILIFFAIVASLFILVGDFNRIDSLFNILIGLNVTVVIFSVNFSFLEYQFSPYRTILKPSMRLHRLLSILLLFISVITIGLCVLFIDYRMYIAYSGIIISVIGSIYLSNIVVRESSGKNILNRYVSYKELKNFLPKLTFQVDKSLQQNSFSRDSEIMIDAPLHEWHNEPVNIAPVEKDPINMLVNLSFIAIDNHDTIMFNSICERGIEYFEQVGEYRSTNTVSKDYDIDRHINEYLNNSFELIIKYCVNNDKTFLFIKALNKILIEKITYLSKSKALNSNIISRLYSHLRNISRELLLEKLENDALHTISLNRKLLQLGISNPLKDKENPDKNDFYFVNYLPVFVNQIEELAEISIKHNNSHFLYRCLDALAWPGCHSVPKDIFPVYESILNSLVRLGRLARKHNMQCFWDSCALTPYDHVLERLNWIGGCVVKKDFKDKESYELMLLNDAYSRLLGYETEVTYKEGKNVITKSDIPYKISRNEDGILKEIDFSDENIISNLKLTGSNSSFRVTSNFSIDSV